MSACHLGTCVSEAVGLHMTCRGIVVHICVCVCICEHMCTRVYCLLFLFNKCFFSAFYLPDTVLSTLEY